MILLPQSPKVINKKDNKAEFEIEGLYPGYGITIGNSLRRVLLSSLEGAAITQVKIRGAQHEFSTIPNVLEDVIAIVSNLKKLRFRLFSDESQKASLKIKGEKKVKGSDFKVPTQLELENKSEQIATLTSSKAELDLEVQVEKGIGYEPVERRKRPKKLEIGVIPIDAIFSPVRKVNYKVENMRVGERTDFDRLKIEIETDGTISPEEAFFQASEILIKHFSLGSDAFRPKEKVEKQGKKAEKKPAPAAKKKKVEKKKKK